MKKAFYIFAAAALTLGIQSCENAASLARDLDGTWAGVPERLFETDASSGTVIETFTFAPADSVTDGGTVSISALTSVSGAVSGVVGITEPVSVTASGVASVNGSWKAISADRVELALDLGSMTVKVDPDAVVMNADILSDGPAPATMAQLKPQLAESIAAQLRKSIGERYAAMSQMDGVSIKDNGNTLRFKINKSSYSLTRQPD